MPESAVRGPVHVIGAGLLGTSIGLALRRAGVEVWLSDVDDHHLRTAAGLGAGVPAPVGQGSPALVVVAVPPAAIAATVARALHSDAVVTDVGSVKGQPLDEVAALVDAEALTRYVGSHPMAGSERSGPLAGSAVLFDGRPWAVTSHQTAAADAVAAVEALADACGAVAVRMTPDQHDQAVARTSHLPHLMAVLVAGQLAQADREQLALSGQGVRDVTRIAGGDPALWQQIISGNAGAVRGLLDDVRTDLDTLIGALDDPSRLDVVLRRGVAGTRAIPGKHGGRPQEMASVYVSVPDHPGELARLFSDVGEIGTNIEDIRIDHDPGRPVGLTELLVEAGAADPLRDSLEARNWVVHR
ncbi:MAG: prephenate dehydrogenase [Actinomycetota bacterium]|nr:prephenate dehydrogenase [Actinomycetota bacterium]